MTTPYVYQGAVAPEALSVTITPETGTPLDLSTVTACSLKVTTSSGSVSYWDAAITSQSSSQLVVAHEFESGDVDTVGLLSVMPHLTVPSGTRRCAPFSLQVKKG